MLTQKSCFAVFHLNLAFSAVPEAERARVIRSCYLPLLEVISQQGVPLGIECTGWTLREIAKWVPGWVKSFKLLLAQGSCSLIGSGYVQLIAPLVPYRVNRWNQELGLAVYQELLGTRPQLAMVNEMAFSASQVDLYREMGYRGLVLERENVVPALEGQLPQQGPWLAQGQSGKTLPVLFSDTILFQKFQRFVQGDIEADEYWPFLKRWSALDQALPLYCSDGEIFGYRPKRYHYEESKNLNHEWARLSELMAEAKRLFQFISPEAALVEGSAEPLALTSCAFPIVVKKQPKYNVARWAVSGRDDLALNSRCYTIEAQLKDAVEVPQREQLCRLFSSDLRTHVEPLRWAQVNRELNALCPAQEERGRLSLSNALPVELEIHRSSTYLKLKTPRMDLVLNLRRGLAIKSLAFNGGPARLGTVPHGYFEQIAFGADFFSGTTVIEVPGQLLRVTDLARCEPELGMAEGRVCVRSSLHTHLGIIEKELSFEPDGTRLHLGYRFPGWKRPFGTVRVGHLTLLPEAWTQPVRLACHQGGPYAERFRIDRACTHHQPVSNLISCTTGFGATTGVLELQDERGGLHLSWDPGQCAAFPMLLHQPCPPSQLTRVIFSLAEMDDTRKEGGQLLPFQLTIEDLN